MKTHDKQTDAERTEKCEIQGKRHGMYMTYGPVKHIHAIGQGKGIGKWFQKKGQFVDGGRKVRKEISWGKRKKFEKVCASKTSLTATAIKRPRNVEATATRMTAGIKAPHTTPDRSVIRAAMSTGTNALARAHEDGAAGLGQHQDLQRDGCQQESFKGAVLLLKGHGHRQHGGGAEKYGDRHHARQDGRDGFEGRFPT